MDGISQTQLEQLNELARGLEELADMKKFRMIDFFHPYKKQLEFIDLGDSKRERLLMAGNQTGKTEIGAYEVACHLTGLYPENWRGRRWDRPVKGWAAGITSISTRDIVQKKLCGEPGVKELFGTGMIPKELILDVSLARGVSDAYDTISVRHVSGGVSVLKFKSYEQGRAKWQGDTLDFIWCDEEPPEDVYSEGLTRITATAGMVFITFTPLLGMSSVVMRYLQEKSEDRGVVSMTISDALHIPESERAKIIAGYPAHEREARAKGIPMLGSGRIFAYSEEQVGEATMQYVPPHWPRMWAIDFGIDHPFAAVLGAWDKDADIIHILHAIKMRDAAAWQHTSAMLKYEGVRQNVRGKFEGSKIPVAWPQDGHQRDTGNLEPMSKLYRDNGLLMLPHHAKFADGSNSTETGIMEMNERFGSGRLKVAAHLEDWFSEFRLYHRKDGLIVKLNDDLMSATRVWVMAKRFARIVGYDDRQDRPPAPVAKDVDFDVFDV